MYFKQINRWRQSLLFRLTIWYGGIFALSSLVVLSIFYLRISAISLERTDRELHEELEEFVILMERGGRTAIRQEIDMEVASEPAEELFFRLLTPQGNVIAASDLRPWGEIKMPADLLSRLKFDSPLLETLEHAGTVHSARVIYGRVGPTEIMQIGMSLAESDAYLSIFRHLLLTLMAPILLAAMIIGWFMARKALAGVDDVTHTARRITKGAYDQRVQVKHPSYEVNQLAQAFNHMVDQLQNLLKTMRDMTDNIAHDLRSPLTRIRGIAEMTLMKDTDARHYQDMAVSTIEECDKLIDLINTTLDITEAESGFMELQLEDIELSLLVREACELFRPLAEEKKIHLAVNSPEKIVLKSDRRKLQRIVTNLLENAIKYTPENGHVRLQLTKEKSTVQLAVVDNGIGIAENELPNIFKRFYRCDLSRSQSGIGLGLSLVKVFVELLHGSIRVTSRQNQGSTFTVKLPA